QRAAHPRQDGQRPGREPGGHQSHLVARRVREERPARPALRELAGRHPQPRRPARLLRGRPRPAPAPAAERPPPPPGRAARPAGAARPPRGGAPPAANFNVLRALALPPGGVVWSVGSPYPPPQPEHQKDGGLGEMFDCFLLGPPLPLGGKLYVLAERQKELRL